jgi:hypothetical protein
MAVDMKTGKVLWSYQVQADDLSWGCNAAPGPTVRSVNGPDLTSATRPF